MSEAKSLFRVQRISELGDRPGENEISAEYFFSSRTAAEAKQRELAADWDLGENETKRFVPIDEIEVLDG